MGKSIREIKKLCKKPYWHILQEIDHKLAMYLTWIFARTPINPNQVTILWILIQFIGPLFFIIGEYKYMLIGIIIYHFGSLFDSVDGQLARYKKYHSLKGVYIDNIGHHITIPALFIFLSIGVSKMHNDPIYIAFGVLASLSFLYNKLFTLNIPDKLTKIKNNLHVKNQKGVIPFIIGFVRVEHIFNLLFWLILFNYANYALIVYSIFFLLDMLKRLITILIKLDKIDKKCPKIKNR